MIKYNIFGHDVFKFHCDDVNLYTNKKLTASINLLLDHPLVQTRTHTSDYDSAYGGILTSVGNDYSDLTVLPGIDNLLDWVSKQITSTRDGAKSVTYTRTWVNKMFKDSEALVHAHSHPDFVNNTTEFVAIFYVNASADSANLTFIQDGNFNTHYYEYPEDRRHPVPNLSGDLLVHDISIHHSVSKHIHDEPRICLVFEGYFNG